MFERPGGNGERAVLVHIEFPRAKSKESNANEQEVQSEFYDLVLSAGADPLSLIKGKRYKPYKRNMDDKNQFPVWCIENKKEVIINDIEKDYSKYL